MDDIVDAIVLEAERMKFYMDEPIDTIYFGGGTPSILDEKQLSKIVAGIHKHYSIKDSLEFTLEANPDDLTNDKLIILAKLGVNRLSIGTQSFSNTVLSLLNRSHTAKQTKDAVELSRQVGINNLSLDLIYGIPNQTNEQWQQNLQELVDLNPTHVSCYALTIEDKTVFGNWYEKGKLKPVAEELVITEYDFMVEFLTSNGFEHYEVSNFAKPGFHSNHNSSYWEQKKYLGLGPGAHSFSGSERHFNVSNNPKYIKFISKNINPFKKEILSKKELLTEYIFTRIRTIYGVNFDEVSNLFNYNLSESQLAYIDLIVSDKLATFVDNKLLLNSKGFFVSDSIVLELIPD